MSNPFEKYLQATIRQTDNLQSKTNPMMDTTLNALVPNFDNVSIPTNISKSAGDLLVDAAASALKIPTIVGGVAVGAADLALSAASKPIEGYMRIGNALAPNLIPEPMDVGYGYIAKGLHDTIGYRPEEAKAFIDEKLFSDARKIQEKEYQSGYTAAEDKAFQDSWVSDYQAQIANLQKSGATEQQLKDFNTGFDKQYQEAATQRAGKYQTSWDKPLSENIDIIGHGFDNLLENPSLALGGAIESGGYLLPSILVSRGVLALEKAAKVAKLGAGGVGAIQPLHRFAAAGVSEGSVAGTVSLEQMRSQMPDGIAGGKELLGALGVAGSTGLIGGAFGKAASKLGIGDIDAVGLGRAASQVAAMKLPALARPVGAIAQEGTEEFLQTFGESIIPNVTMGKDPLEGLGQELPLGTMAGAIMGAGMNAPSLVTGGFSDISSGLGKAKDAVTSAASLKSFETLSNPEHKNYNPAQAFNSQVKNLESNDETVRTQAQASVDKITTDLNTSMATVGAQIAKIEAAMKAMPPVPQMTDAQHLEVAALRKEYDSLQAKSEQLTEHLIGFLDAQVSAQENRDAKKGTQFTEEQAKADIATLTQPQTSTAVWSGLGGDVPVEVTGEAYIDDTGDLYLPVKYELNGEMVDASVPANEVTSQPNPTDTIAQQEALNRVTRHFSKYSTDDLDLLATSPILSKAQRNSLRLMSESKRQLAAVQDPSQVFDNILNGYKGKTIQESHRGLNQYTDMVNTAVATKNEQLAQLALDGLGAFTDDHTAKKDTINEAFGLVQKGTYKEVQVVRTQDGTWGMVPFTAQEVRAGKNADGVVFLEGKALKAAMNKVGGFNVHINSNIKGAITQINDETQLIQDRFNALSGVAESFVGVTPKPVDTSIAPTVDTPIVDVQGINIHSKEQGLGKALTNPNNAFPIKYEGREYSSVEHAYQSNKSGKFDNAAYDAGKGKFKVAGTLGVDTKGSSALMVKLLKAKLEQYPQLIQAIKERGGVEFLNKSTHDTGAKDYWTTKGNNGFITALSRAYTEATSTVDTPIVTEPSDTTSPIDNPAPDAPVQSVAPTKTTVEDVPVSKDEASKALGRLRTAFAIMDTPTVDEVTPEQITQWKALTTSNGLKRPQKGIDAINADIAKVESYLATKVTKASEPVVTTPVEITSAEKLEATVKSFVNVREITAEEYKQDTATVYEKQWFKVKTAYNSTVRRLVELVAKGITTVEDVAALTDILNKLYEFANQSIDLNSDRAGLDKLTNKIDSLATVLFSDVDPKVIDAYLKNKIESQERRGDKLATNPDGVKSFDGRTIEYAYNAPHLQETKTPSIPAKPSQDTDALALVAEDEDVVKESARIQFGRLGRVLSNFPYDNLDTLPLDKFQAAYEDAHTRAKAAGKASEEAFIAAFKEVEDYLKSVETKNLASQDTPDVTERGKQAPVETKEVGFKLTPTGQYTAKDQIKADKATKFIGEGVPNSSTAQYAKDAGNKANTGEYTKDDVVFVSVNGARANRKSPNFVEIQKAVDAGATILTDKLSDRERSFNIGEREVAAHLTKNGYVEEGATGVWKPEAKTAEATPPVVSGIKIEGNNTLITSAVSGLIHSVPTKLVNGIFEASYIVKELMAITSKALTPAQREYLEGLLQVFLALDGTILVGLYADLSLIQNDTIRETLQKSKGKAVDYLDKGKRIYIDLNNVEPVDLFEILVHEYHHTVTMQGLKKVEGVGKSSPQYVRLNAAYKAVKAFTDSNPTVDARVLRRLEYMLKNLREFLTVGMVEPTVIEALKGISVSEGKSVYDEISAVNAEILKAQNPKTFPTQQGKLNDLVSTTRGNSSGVQTSSSNSINTPQVESLDTTGNDTKTGNTLRPVATIDGEQTGRGTSEATQSAETSTESQVEPVATEDAKVTVLQNVTDEVAAEERKKPFNLRNILKGYFTQSTTKEDATGANPLVTVKDFISNFDVPTQVSKWLNDRRKPTQKQLEQVEHFKKFHAEFARALKFVFNTQASAIFVSNRENLVGYMEMGKKASTRELDENVVTALALSAYSYLIKQGNKVMNTNEELETLFRFKKGMRAPLHIEQMFRFAGQEMPVVVKALGTDAAKALGLKVREDQDPTLQDRLNTSLGILAMEAMANAGFIVIETLQDHPTDEKNKPLTDFLTTIKAVRESKAHTIEDEYDFEVDTDAETQIKKFTMVRPNAKMEGIGNSVFEKGIIETEVDGKIVRTETLTLNRPVLTKGLPTLLSPLVNELIEANKDTKGFLSYLFGVDVGLTTPLKEIPKKFSQKLINGTDASVPSAQAALLTEAQKHSFTMRTNTVAVFAAMQKLGENSQFLKEVLGIWIDDHVLSRTHVTERDSLQAKAQNDWTAVLNGLEWAEATLDENGQYTQFYDTQFVAQNQRQHLNSNMFSAQSSQIHRAMAALTGFSTTIDLTKDEALLNLFYQAVGEGLEGLDDYLKADILAKAEAGLHQFFTVDKVYGDYYVPALKAFLETDASKNAIKAMRALIETGTINTDQQKDIAAFVNKGKMGAQSLQSLIALAELDIAQDSKEQILTTTIGFGSDGVNHGVSAANMLTGVISKDMRQQTGIFPIAEKGQDQISNMQEVYKRKITDYYVDFGKVMSSKLRDLVDSFIGGKDNPFVQGMTALFPKFEVLDDTRELRNLLDMRKIAKIWAIPFNYSAGKAALQRALARGFLASIYGSMNKLANEALDIIDAQKEDGITAEQLAALDDKLETVKLKTDTLQDNLNKVLSKYGMGVTLPAPQLLNEEDKGKLSGDLENTLMQAAIDLHGEAAWQATEEFAKEYLEVRNVYTEVEKASFTLFDVVRSQLIEEKKANRKFTNTAAKVHVKGKTVQYTAEELNAQEAEYFGLTTAEMAEIDAELTAMRPMFNTALSVGSESTNDASNAINPSGVSVRKHKMQREPAKGLRAVNTCYLKEIDANGKPFSESRNIGLTKEVEENAGVASSANAIQSVDAFVAAKIQGFMVALNAHDNAIFGLKDFLKGVKKQNEEHLKALTNYQLGLEHAKMLVKVYVGYKAFMATQEEALKSEDVKVRENAQKLITEAKQQMKVLLWGEQVFKGDTALVIDGKAVYKGGLIPKLQAANRDIKDNAEIDEAISVFIDYALKQDLQKLEVLLDTHSIHQFAGEGGMHQLTDENKASITEQKALVNKAKEDLQAELEDKTVEQVAEVAKPTKPTSTPQTPSNVNDGSPKSDLILFLEEETAANAANTDPLFKTEWIGGQQLVEFLKRAPEKQTKEWLQEQEVLKAIEPLLPKFIKVFYQDFAEEGYGYYDEATNSIYIKPHGLKGSKVDSHLIIHELLHSATSLRIKALNASIATKTAEATKTGKPATFTPAEAALNKLDELRQIILSRVKGIPALSEMLKNVDEFISYGLTDQRLQQVLGAVPVERNGRTAPKVNSKWRTFVLAVMKVTGFKSGGTITALSAFAMDTAALLETIGSVTPVVASRNDEKTQIDAVRKKYAGTKQWMKAPNGQPTKLNELQWLQVRTPNFKAWFGDWENDPKNASQVVDANGEPMIVYHGTMQDFSEFKSSGQAGGLLFFTSDINIANDYAEGRRRGYLGMAQAEVQIVVELGAEANPQNFNGLSILANTSKEALLKILSRMDTDVTSSIEQRLEEGVITATQAIAEFNEFTATFTEGANVVPVFIVAKNLFNTAENPVEWKQAEKNSAESYKAKGHDGVYVTESDGVALAVFNPTQVKSAIGNTGEFNATSPSIHYSRTSAEDLVNGQSSLDIMTALPHSNTGAFNQQLDRLIVEEIGQLYNQDDAAKARIDEIQTFTASDALNAGFTLSRKEQYVQQALQYAVAAYRKLHGGGANEGQLNRVYHAAKVRIDPTGKDFHEGDWATATQQEQDAAKAKYDFLFDSTKEGYMDRFVSMALASESVSKILDIALPLTRPETQDKTWFEKVSDWVAYVMAWLSNKYVRLNPTLGASNQLVQLMDNLVKLDIRNRQEGVALHQKAWNTIGLVTTPLNNALKGAGGALLSGVGLRESRFLPVRALGAILVLRSEEAAKAIPKMIIDMRNNQLPNTKLGEVANILLEASGVGTLRDKFDVLIRQTNLNAKNRQDIVDNVKKAVNKWFKEPLTKAQHAAIAYGLLGTDAQALLENYSVEDIVDMALHEGKLNVEIAKLKKEIAKNPNGNDMLNAADQLGYYMVTRIGGEGLVKNALGISIGLGTQYFTSVEQADPKLVSQLNKLASMLAMTHVPNSDKAILAALYKTDAEGVHAVIQLHQGLVNDSLKDFQANPLNMVKGWMPEVTNPYLEIKAANSMVERQQMEREGWVLIDELKRDKHDKGSPKYLMKHNDIGYQRLVSGAVDLGSTARSGTEAINRTSPKYLGITQARYQNAARRAAIPNGSFDPSKQPRGLIAAYDTDGAALGYNYEMDNETRDAHLDRKHNTGDLLGTFGGLNYYKPEKTKQSNVVAEVLFEDYKANYSQNPNAYLKLSHKSTDPKVLEMWRMLPQDFKQRATELYGKGNPIIIRNEAFNLAFGFKKFSVVSYAFDAVKAERERIKNGLVGTGKSPNAFQSGFVRLAEATRGNTAQADFAKAEHVTQEIVKAIKDFIVIRSGTTMMWNIFANVLMLMANGINPVTIIKDWVFAVTNVRAYQKLNSQLIQAQADLAGGKDPVALKQKIGALKAELKANVMNPYINAGLLSSIVEDVNIQQGEYTYASAFKQAVDEKTQWIPKPVKTAAKVLTIAPSTKLYQFLATTTQLSDFVAKYSMSKHLQANGTDINAAIIEASKTFINYDLPTSQGLQYANDMGLFMFTKFFLRIQAVLMKLLGKRAGSAIAQHLLVENLTGAEGVLSPMALGHVGNTGLHSSIFEVPSAFFSIGTVDAVTDVGVPF